MKKGSATRASAKPSAKAPQSIRTLKDLAALVSRDIGTVSRWLKRDDWSFGGFPIPRSAVPKIQRWMADTLERQAEAVPTGTGDVETKQLRKDKLREEVRKLRANADQAETALARERGALMDAAEVAQEWAGIGVVVRNGFQNLASQLVPLALSHGMPQEAAAAFQQQIEEAVAGVLRHLSRDGKSEDDGDGA